MSLKIFTKHPAPRQSSMDGSFCQIKKKLLNVWEEKALKHWVLIESRSETEACGRKAELISGFLFSREVAAWCFTAREAAGTQEPMTAAAQPQQVAGPREPGSLQLENPVQRHLGSAGNRRLESGRSMKQSEL